MIKKWLVTFNISGRKYLSLLFWRALIYPIGFSLILLFKKTNIFLDPIWISLLLLMIINSFFSPFCIHFFKMLLKEKATEKYYRAISLSGEHGNILYYLLLQFLALFISLFLFWKLRSNSSRYS